MEYMACGLPVIITRVPSFSKVVSDRRAGLIVSYDEEEFAQAAGRLMVENDFCGEIRGNALRLAAEYDYEAIFIGVLNAMYRMNKTR